MSGSVEWSTAASAPEPARRLDPITIELVRNNFSSICDEMAESLVRSSHSPNIKERRDCSCCLYSPSGEMAVQAEHIPIHLGVMPYALRAILEAFPAADMLPGDCFIVNDPYYGGNHLPDFIVAGPLFLERTLVGFAASMAHHTDVGGMSPRSMPAKAVEIFQEGLRVPPVQLAKEGRLDAGLLRLIAANSRLPDERIADLGAQIATIKVAQRRIEEMGRRHTAAELIEVGQAILDLSEAAMRRALRELPDGEWRGESTADFGGTLIPLRVAVRKRSDEIVVDFAGSGEQTVSPFNSCLSNTYACVLMALRVSIAEGIPGNAGMYRALRMDVPEGSILNPRYPAAVSAATQVSYHTFEALMRALAPLAGERNIADTGGGGVFSFGGFNPQTGALFAYGEALGGGSGASPHADGDSGVLPPVANLHDTPAEALEMSLPVRIERYELVEDSAGLGRQRGGLGLRRAFRMLTPVRCAFQVSMPTKRPAGLSGGGSGRPTHVSIIDPDGTSRAIAEFTECPAPAGSLVVIETAGGGGYGALAERSDALVAADVRDGYVSGSALDVHPKTLAAAE
jgi:N-methylhydantoinase B